MRLEPGPTLGAATARRPGPKNRPGRPAPRRGPWLALACALAAAGCHREEDSRYKSAAAPPKVRLVQPAARTITRYVGQPSFIEAYERTSIYPKLTGYIDRWIVDIGDRVKKGDLLAKLFVPELVEDFGTKKATVTLDEQRVEMARKVVEVAAADVRAAKARLEEAQSILGKYQSEVDRWDTEVKRLTREVSRGVVDPQVLLESTNQLKSSTAARDAAGASIRTAEAEVISYEAKDAKARVDVAVAGADLAVATSEARRLEAWVGYISLTAPFDGVVVARNANTSDFVRPGAGDPTADARSPYEAPGGTAAPIYVVDRTDIVRVFVDIPEQDANSVRVGTAATVLARGYRDEPIKATVTRTSWALNVKSRTLRAEIDLENPNSQLLPGMYAYANVVIERPGARAVPVAATTHAGDKTYCWLYSGGKARKAEVRTGVTDGEYIELTSFNKSPDPRDAEVHLPWEPITGAEELILGDLATLADGGDVEVIQPGTAKGQDQKPATAGRAADRPAVALRP